MPLTIHTPPHVYAPREDSHLLAETAAKNAQGRVLDMCCGSGIVGLYAMTRPIIRVTFADQNPLALEAVKKNVAQNQLHQPFETVLTDLFSNIRGNFETLFFNPPYLPTAEAEKLGEPLNKALDGGADGRRLINPFLDQFDKHLAQDGAAYILNSSVSATDGQSGNEITQKALEKKGLTVQEVAKADFFFEHLVVFEARKP
ncbi:methyltransferase [Candidatus Micrarchaeota archaeon]|nr:methyltransferase [Candidatus Micrarchaeota archaeon]